MAWIDIQTRYRRTKLGPIWFTLGNGLALGGMGTVWALIFGMDLAVFFPYMAAGYVTWTMWAEFMAAGSTTFTSGEAAATLRDLPMSPFVHPLRFTTRTFFSYFHNILVFIFAALVAQTTEVNLYNILVIPGLIFTFINGLWITTLFGMMGARFRDVTPFINSFLIFIFMVTPIMWTTDMVRGKFFIAAYNPFYHFIEIVRAPLLGQPVASLSWIVVCGLTVFGCTLTFYLFHTRRSRIVFWL